MSKLYVPVFYLKQLQRSLYVISALSERCHLERISLVIRNADLEQAFDENSINTHWILMRYSFTNFCLLRLQNDASIILPAIIIINILYPWNLYIKFKRNTSGIDIPIRRKQRTINVLLSICKGRQPFFIGFFNISIKIQKGLLFGIFLFEHDGHLVTKINTLKWITRTVLIYIVSFFFAEVYNFTSYYSSSTHTLSENFHEAYDFISCKIKNPYLISACFRMTTKIQFLKHWIRFLSLEFYILILIIYLR